MIVSFGCELLALVARSLKLSWHCLQGSILVTISFFWCGPFWGVQPDIRFFSRNDFILLGYDGRDLTRIVVGL